MLNGGHFGTKISVGIERILISEDARLCTSVRIWTKTLVTCASEHGWAAPV